MLWVPKTVRQKLCGSERAVQMGKIGDVQMVRVFFADHPVPPIEFLTAGGGDPFTDLAPHDIDFVRWVLDDEALKSMELDPPPCQN